ncbi:MAG: YolD-like family protein [Dorea sp.]|nr:YolD-like family protein [Dorea sp.]
MMDERNRNGLREKSEVRNQRELQENSGKKSLAGHPYEELFAYEKPVLRHPAMDLGDRAKIFSPFAALTGHGDAIEEMQQLRVNRRILSEFEQSEINRVIVGLSRADTFSCTYFEYDPGSDGSGYEAEGRYVTISGVVKKLDQVQGVILLEDGRRIPMSEIVEMERL